MKYANWKTKNRENLIIFSLFFLVLGSFCIKGIFLSDYFNSLFLLSDDTIIFGRYLFGEKFQAPEIELFFVWLKFLTNVGGLLLVKFSTLFLPFFIALCLAITALRITGNAYAAAFTSILVAHFPVAANQNYFISGGHPTAATAVFALYVLFLSEQLHGDLAINRVKNLLNISVQGVLLLSCTYISPTYYLIPFIAFISSSYLVLREKSRNGYSGYLIAFWVLGIAPAIITLMHLGSYHYSGMEGWINYSLSNIFNNLLRATNFVIFAPFKGHAVYASLYIGLAFVFLAILAVSTFWFKIKYRDLQSSHTLKIVLLCLLSAVLVFGPASILTMYSERYAVPFFYLLSFALVFLLAWCVARVRESSVRASIGLNLVLFILASVAAIHNIAITQDRLKPLMAGYEILRQALEVREWEDSDQILFVLPEEAESMSVGYNHWSTWQLRILTQRLGIIGLIGVKGNIRDLNSNGVFIDKYMDHGGIFWRMRNGKKQRIRMLGLEWGRPLYAFMPDEKGSMKLLPALIWDGKGTRLVPIGGIPASVAPKLGDLPCSSQYPATEYFFISTIPDVPDRPPCQSNKLPRATRAPHTALPDIAA